MVLAAVLLLLVVGAYQLRRAYVRSFFIDGPGDGAMPALAMPERASDRDGLTRVSRVRVVLLDGVGLGTARRLPSYSALCEQGHDLVVDVGFPTVSLPVQHVLWTGLTQSQTGVMFRGKQQILSDPRPPPTRGIPLQVPGSVAVAESHQYIVHALGFATTLPASPIEVPAGWIERDFLDAATSQVIGDAPLVFVHILRVDVAGHRKGGVGTRAYRDAAEQADAMLGQLVAAGRARRPDGASDTRWFVIADHGHRGAGLYGPGGGHGGATREIRLVRGCVAGALDRSVPVGATIHLVDLARAIADSVGVTLADTSAGRPLYAAIRAAREPGATLPVPSLVRWLAALALALVVLAATGWSIRGHLGHLPWWWPVALVSVMLLEATPSLSVPMVYRPLGRIVYMTALPGVVVLAVVVTGALRRLGAVRAVIAQLAIPLGGALIAGILSGGAAGVELMWGPASEPPLMPHYTAYTSVFIVLWQAGAVVCSAALAVTALAPSWFGMRGQDAGSRDGSPVPRAVVAADPD